MLVVYSTVLEQNFHVVPFQLIHINELRVASLVFVSMKPLLIYFLLFFIIGFYET